MEPASELPADAQSAARSAARSPPRTVTVRSPFEPWTGAVAPAPSPAVRDAADLLADGSSETAKVRRLSKENRTLRQRLKELELEAAEEKEEVDSLIEELSKEIIELTEENQEAHRINDEMSAEIVELTADLEQAESKLDGRRESEYQKVLDALSRQQDDDDALDLLQQIKQLAEQLEHVEREKVEIERRLARTAREHTSAIARRQSRIEELQAMLDVANAEIASLRGRSVAGGAGRAVKVGGQSYASSLDRAVRAGGQNHASSLDDIESGSSASESGDSYISAASGAASSLASAGGSSGTSSGWRLWPAGSAGPFTSVLSVRRTVGRNEGLPT